MVARHKHAPHWSVPNYERVLYKEELSRVNEGFCSWLWRCNVRLQCKENKRVISFIRKLDKHTLNMYTSLRAEVGTQELSWLRIGVREIWAN